MARAPSAAGIVRRGLRDHVYERILRLLLAGRLAPGARLTIDTLARQLDVSPTPVREALVHLERTGLVQREARKGYRVAPPLGPDELDEVCRARLMLETTAVRWLHDPSPAVLQDLVGAQQRHRAVGEQLVAGLADGRVDLDLATAYFATDTDFHRVILDACGNRYLQAMSESLGAQLHRMRQSAGRGVPDVAEAVSEHAAVVEAFHGRGPLRPEAAMRQHLENVRTRSLTQAAPGR